MAIIKENETNIVVSIKATEISGLTHLRSIKISFGAFCSDEKILYDAENDIIGYEFHYPTNTNIEAIVRSLDRLSLSHIVLHEIPHLNKLPEVVDTYSTLNTDVLPKYNCSNCKHFVKPNHREIHETKIGPYAIECRNLTHPLLDCVLRGFEGHSLQPGFSQTLNKK